MLISREKSSKRFHRVRLLGACLVGLFVVISLAQYRSPSLSTLSAPESSRPARSAAKAVSDPAQPLNQAAFDAEMSRLDALIRANDLGGLVAAADQIENTWQKEGGQLYGRLMLEVSNSLANSFSGTKPDELSQKYASLALARADTMSLRLETILLDFLSRDLTANTQEANWAKERSDKTKLWLHAWARLENGINRNFDFDDRPLLKVRPPDETALPAGVAPEAIKDQKLRVTYKAAIAANAAKTQEYNRQIEFKSLDGLFTKKAEEYIVRVYAQPPYNLDELERHLTASGLDQTIRKRVLSEVVKRLSQAKN
jgi:hypothetical protein